MRVFASLVFALALAGPAAAQPTIAPTDPKSPADENASFTLPPGFEAQLVASEPDIEKPIQLAFDAKGRLWVTTTRLYPFAAPEGKGTDKIFVLSDFGPDGRAKKVTAFASNLNIPIGVLPLPDCNSCLASQVGSIVKLTDTDGDGTADKTEPILTGFGREDTHGMMNSFLLLPDGWVYATHGFKNTSVVKGKDGSEVRMQSGNTFRFRPDGSRVEHWTFGQVNPFGLAVDPWLNLYTADCHSKPITQLIRGAYYQSFGKPHDGLGFAPHVTDHSHGSTAICGLAWYDADHFPKEYRGCMFLGNVVTNRINADRIEWKGATPVAKELPDFLTSRDPWFRPTDIKLGPDGALYVADFYNRIIGHYEVDLKHPGRDKDRGRVWRIVYKGEDGQAKPPTMPFKDLSKLTVEKAVVHLGDANLTVRLLATLVLMGKKDEFLKAEGFNIPPTPAGSAHMSWVMFGLSVDPAQGLSWALRTRSREEPGIDFSLVHELLQCAETPRWITKSIIDEAPVNLRDGVLHCLTDRSPHVVRAAVDALIAHPHADNVAPLMKLIRSTPAEDVTLRFAARVALRNALRDANGWDAAAKAATTDADRAVITDVVLGVANADAAKYLLAQIEADRAEPRHCEHVGRYGDDAAAGVVAVAVQGKRAELAGLLALARGVQARGSKLPAAAATAAEQACVRGLDKDDTTAAASDLAIGLKLPALADPLAKTASDTKRAEPSRAAALAALLAVDAAKGVPLAASVLTDASAPAGLREKAAAALGAANRADARGALIATLGTAPARLAGPIAAAMANSKEGADALLLAVKQGKASPQLLQDKAVSAKLNSVDGGRFKPLAAELTKGLPSADAKLTALLKARAESFAKAKPDAELGKAVFAKTCAGCHQIAGQGAKVGPQLDGIGNRGADRLLEDVLDPNRNVDAAFRTTVLNLVDGRTLSGLLLREEGQVLVLADPTGKEVRVPSTDVEKRTLSPASPMPANFDTAVPDAEFQHLLAFLLAQRVKDGGK